MRSVSVMTELLSEPSYWSVNRNQRYRTLLPNVTDLHNLTRSAETALADKSQPGGWGATMPERRILLVEDDPDVAPILEHVLIDEGYSVHVARTLKEARSHLDERAYSLVVADLRLRD